MTQTETPSPPAADRAPREETYNWDELLPVVAAPEPTYSQGATVDVMTEIPATIRRAVELSLAATVVKFKAAEAKGTNLKNVNPPWQLQRVPTLAMGETFKKLITRYAKYRPAPAEGKPGIEFQESGTPDGQITLRAGEPTQYVFDSDGKPSLFRDGMNGTPVLCVRFVAKPFEARKDTKAA